ncbi:hypothetical protein DCAR_0209354 [Daucus carota subsp. sativus]|uniref:Uncharacterized protein n=1 Tax=Daucus carota subsp. sativus TaxID=79200 RepID=A0A166F7K7_DAUCS|nr:PREDICTED: protein HAIKU1-like [Daucus carota subsp. sativus]WOG90113.1 hypothetical protein DCAR_0209354 [Daucus carota subsp. sativus]
MDDSKNKYNEHLGVNKIGKNIRKSPMHQPTFTNTARQQPQPQVYNINKNDFRNIVQQLTGSPSHHDPLPRPPQNPSKRRPPHLAPINVNRPQMSQMPHRPAPLPVPSLPPSGSAVPLNNNFSRPPSGNFGPPLPPMMPPPYPPGDQVWSNTAESPISAYMRYLQHSILDSGPRQNQMHPQHQPPYPGPNMAYPPSSGLLPNPSGPPLPSPRMNGPPPLPSPRMNGPPPLPSPRMNGPPPLPSPRMNGPPPLPSPTMNGAPPLLPSPTSQFLLPSPLPSPYGFMNMLSPRSPYPLLSPGYQFPPPLTPNFSFSSVPQSGILGPGPHPPPSPGYGFPLSPSGFFPLSSPRWRDPISSPRWRDQIPSPRWRDQ